MKNVLVKLSFIVLIIFCSCKKEKNDPPVTNTPIPVADNGILSKTTEQETEADTLKNLMDEGGLAFFYGGNGSAFVSVDSVSINNVYLQFSSDHYETLSATGLSAPNWHVKGNNGIPSFDFTNTNGMPSYNGYALIPDSINHTQSITIPISGIINATHAIITINDGWGHSVNHEVNVTANSISFTSAELAAFQSNLYSYLYIVLYNENIQNFGGKRFNFQNQYQITKRVVIY
jgi:hypothetical protein